MNSTQHFLFTSDVRTRLTELEELKSAGLEALDDETLSLEEVNTFSNLFDRIFADLGGNLKPIGETPQQQLRYGLESIDTVMEKLFKVLRENPNAKNKEANLEIASQINDLKQNFLDKDKLQKMGFVEGPVKVRESCGKMFTRNGKVVDNLTDAVSKELENVDKFSKEVRSECLAYFRKLEESFDKVSGSGDEDTAKQTFRGERGGLPKTPAQTASFKNYRFMGVSGDHHFVSRRKLSEADTTYFTESDRGTDDISVPDTLPVVDDDNKAKLAELAIQFWDIYFRTFMDEKEIKYQRYWKDMPEVVKTMDKTDNATYREMKESFDEESVWRYTTVGLYRLYDHANDMAEAIYHYLKACQRED